MTAVPSLQARIDELINVSRGLLLELEATRKQVSFIGEIAQDLLKQTVALKSDTRLTEQLHHH